MEECIGSPHRLTIGSGQEVERGVRLQTDLYETKCGVLFQHVLEKYPECGESVYEAAG